MVGLGRRSCPLSGRICRGCLAKFAAGGSVGPQLHSGKLLPDFARAASLSRFPIPLCARNISDSGAAYPAHRARLLSPRAVLRHCGRPFDNSFLADSSTGFARGGNCKISSGGVSAVRAAYCAGNLLRLSASFLRSGLHFCHPMLPISSSAIGAQKLSAFARISHWNAFRRSAFCKAKYRAGIFGRGRGGNRHSDRACGLAPPARGRLRVAPGRDGRGLRRCGANPALHHGSEQLLALDHRVRRIAPITRHVGYVCAL